MQEKNITSENLDIIYLGKATAIIQGGSEHEYEPYNRRDS